MGFGKAIDEEHTVTGVRENQDAVKEGGAVVVQGKKIQNLVTVELC